MKKIKKGFIIWFGGAFSSILLITLFALNLISAGFLIFIAMLSLLLFFCILYNLLYEFLCSKNSWAIRNSLLVLLISAILTAAFSVFGVNFKNSVCVIVGIVFGIFCIAVIIYHAVTYIFADIRDAIGRFRDMFYH